MGHLPRFTDAGKALHLRSLDGDPIIFTKMQIGSGVLGNTSVRKLTALIEPRITVPISTVDIDDGYAAIRGYFNNQEVSEGFYYRELGLFAQDPDDASNEILYCYSNTGEKSGYIAEAGSKLIERSVKIIAVVDDAENVSALINGSAVYPSFKDVKEAIAAHNSSSDAHPNMSNKAVHVYIDSSSTEEAELRDGTQEHPYQSINECLDALSGNINRLTIYLKAGGTYDGFESTYFDGSTGLCSLAICDYGSGALPIIPGVIQADSISDIYLSSLHFAPTQDWASDSIFIYKCHSVVVHNVTGNYSNGYNGFISADTSNVTIHGSTVIDAQTAISLIEGSMAVVRNSSIISDVAVHAESSTAYLHDDTNNIEGLVERDEVSMILTHTIMEKLSDGSVLNHLTNTENPHHVSLTQAQLQGGVIDVAHGGTGQEKFTSGSILIGKGADGVGSVSGVGVLCVEKENNPQYKKTLPVTLGGTGASSFTPNRLLVGGTDSVSPLESLAASSGALFFHEDVYQHGTLPVELGGTGQTAITNEVGTSDGNTGGVAPGNVVIPGTDILIAWGKVVVDISEAGKTYTTAIKSTENGKSFANADYALIISGKDDDWGDLSKTADSFTLTTQNAVGSFVADWIAIGKVAS